MVVPLWSSTLGHRKRQVLVQRFSILGIIQGMSELDIIDPLWLSNRVYALQFFMVLLLDPCFQSRMKPTRRLHYFTFKLFRHGSTNLGLNTLFGQGQDLEQALRQTARNLDHAVIR